MIAATPLTTDLLRQMGFDAGEAVWGFYHYQLYGVPDIVNYNKFSVDYRPAFTKENGGVIPEIFRFEGECVKREITTFSDLLAAIAEEYMARGRKEVLKEIKQYVGLLFADV